MTNPKTDNPELTPEQFFKVRFTKLMTDLGENAIKDPETVWLIGSLAGSIIEDANIKSWTALKAALDTNAYDRLLSAFQSQGNSLAKQGNHKAAYAVETLALSVIAPTMSKDNHVAKGNILLDSMISDAITFYRSNPVTSGSQGKPN